MRFAILGSGSKGNSTLIEAGGTRILVDAGLSPKETKRRLGSLGLELNQLSALVITHGHGDHWAAAPALASALRLRTFCTVGTRDMCARRRALQNTVLIEPGAPFEIGPLRLCAFSTPHDAVGSVGFVVDDSEQRLGLCTDLGRPDKKVGRALRDCDALLLEFNHDPEMLQHGPYPAHLKRRVAGPYGHLANEEAAQLLAWAKTSLLRKVLLAHLSETNNLPRLARDAARPVVDGADVELAVAPQHQPTGWLRVGPERRQSPYRTPLEFVSPRPSGPSSGKKSLRDPAAAARRKRVAVAEPALAVSRQLTLFGGGDG